MTYRKTEETGKGKQAEQAPGLARKWQTRQPPIAWTIAGFDPSSGAGVTADLATFAAFGLFGCSAITALTVQNTVGVADWDAVEPALLEATLLSLAADLPAAGIKLGMLGTPELAGVAARQLASMRPRTMPVVFDPVLRSSSGRDLFPADAVKRLDAELLPHVDWITPNWAELALLTGQAVASASECETAARLLARRHPGLHVVATGGDQNTPEDLVVLPSGEVRRVAGSHVATTSTHGTGCAFSSALLSALVLGREPVSAVAGAKRFVEGALRHAPGLGHGRGPMDLLWPLRAARGSAT